MTLSAVAGTPPAQADSRAPVRVMVVDDSVVIRGLVARWVDEEADLVTVAKCANGKIAVDSIEAARPDIVVLDIEMPVMDGMTALPELLKAQPRPHIIIASTLTKRNAAITLKALAGGASECIPKPETNSGVTTSAEFRRELISKIKGLGGLDKPVRSRPAAIAARASGQPASAATSDFELVPFNRGTPSLVAIGSSTGGPRALATVLSDIGSALSAVPVLITQHMPPTFTEMLADNLGKTCGRRAKEAEHGEKPEAGVIYVAPGGKHLIVKRTANGVVMELDDRPPVNFTKPSVDVMFESIAAVYGGSVLSVMLTGMGHDGAAGAVLLRDAGGNVIAQDEATSVVWGMPGAAAHTGKCSAVLPLGEIGARVARLVQGVTS
ncbi:MAG: chemotaxis response regulator protein-glutamate methylesterase [Rhizobiales bacterium]|nr:chemotaxis response regulator protein-glutamate methylesterase [Hyphomicrobiales bacterium]